MIPAIYGVMLALSSSLAASIIAKVTVATALGLMAVRLARGSRAALRHTLLAATFGVLLVLPFVSIVAPPVLIPLRAAARERIVPRIFGGTIRPVAPTRASVGVTSVGPQPAGLSLSALLLAGWIAGMTIFLIPVLAGLWQVRSLRRSARAWPHGQPLVEGLARDAGIRRRVEVLLHGTLPGPMTCGVVHPVIVLPADVQTWEEEELNCALVHELEHVRRGDWVSQCLARALCAVYWFHPLVWIAWRQLALEAERSCDDAVLGRSEATAYADQLVGLAQRLSIAAKTPFLAMANRADLAKRVSAVLDSRRRRGRAGAFPVALAYAAAAMLVLTISPLMVVAAPQATGSEVRPHFLANTVLVMEDVTVTDRKGNSIEGLRANDFAVIEDGVAQPLHVFEFQKLDGMPHRNQDSISSYYILGYYSGNPKRDGRFREIKISLKRDAMARLEYRPGYYAVFSRPGGASIGGIEQTANQSMGFDIGPPRVTYKQDAEYSDEARKAKYSGSTVLSVEVDASGRVARIKVIHSAGLGLDEKAMEAVTQWKFIPAMKDGTPVAMQALVEVNFQLL